VPRNPLSPQGPNELLAKLTLEEGHLTREVLFDPTTMTVRLVPEEVKDILHTDAACSISFKVFPGCQPDPK
jgi:hypothetical protein